MDIPVNDKGCPRLWPMDFDPELNPSKYRYTPEWRPTYVWVNKTKGTDKKKYYSNLFELHYLESQKYLQASLFVRYYIGIEDRQ